MTFFPSSPSEELFSFLSWQQRCFLLQQWLWLTANSAGIPQISIHTTFRRHSTAISILLHLRDEMFQFSPRPTRLQETHKVKKWELAKLPALKYLSPSVIGLRSSPAWEKKKQEQYIIYWMAQAADKALLLPANNGQYRNEWWSFDAQIESVISLLVWKVCRKATGLVIWRLRWELEPAETCCCLLWKTCRRNTLGNWIWTFFTLVNYKKADVAAKVE